MIHSNKWIINSIIVLFVLNIMDNNNCSYTVKISHFNDEQGHKGKTTITRQHEIVSSLKLRALTYLKPLGNR